MIAATPKARTDRRQSCLPPSHHLGRNQEEPIVKGAVNHERRGCSTPVRPLVSVGTKTWDGPG